MKSPPGSGVAYSNTLAEWKAAKGWGLTPDEWIQKPRWARVQMMAEEQASNDIEYWMVEDMKDG